MTQKFKIIELDIDKFNYLEELEKIRVKLLPNYESNFQNMIKIRYDKKKRLNVNVTVGIIENKPIGFMQVYYKYFKRFLFANIDLFAVLKKYRKTGLALALARYNKKRTLDLAKENNINALGIIGLAETDIKNNDEFAAKRLFLYSKLGAQVRKDFIYKTPDWPDAYIIWYPFNKEYSNIDSILLAWFLWEFFPYNKKLFFKYYGKVNIDDLFIKFNLKH